MESLTHSAVIFDSLEAAASIQEIDALIIGAGPVGLFQVFQLGLHEIKTHVVDALPYAGGQCMELYPDKPIYDIPALTVCTGRELTERLLQQIAPFAATFHLNQLVKTVNRAPDGRLLVVTDKGQQFLTKTLLIAAGVGAFVPRKLVVEGLDRFEGSQVFYEPRDHLQQLGPHPVILGDSESALRAAIAICDAQAASPNTPAVTVVHRRDSLSAEPETVDTFRRLCHSGAARFLAGQITGMQDDGRLLSSLTIALPDGTASELICSTLAVYLGLSPKLGPIAEWGLDMDRRQVTVNPATFATREPGIFAIGDVNTYPGKRKLILCGFHEATLAAFEVAQQVFPHKTVALQYTTTSSKLHKVLGVLPS
ncbi:NAD(P)/FAD-dependent oxidoreductase [Rhodoferax aquaticus]|uniref:Ferredoxin--NADP reductase n=1 Tax=Rhodoferax aquaticus TaxID=2527691 RepID=A0A515ENY6_9BURK|nr:NAD(P)/FAD-dependent oxidoreductase [Rhodoferax aquaticus]QDL54350.1 NAD(P)/FAD-dependent oxidoreductase [Rhodoferax aquaticus]